MAVGEIVILFVSALLLTVSISAGEYDVPVAFMCGRSQHQATLASLST